MLTAGLLTLAFAVAGHAGASLFGKVSTSTTLTVSPVAATEGTAITFNASVKIPVVNSLGVIPKGTVVFTVKNGSGTVASIGSASLRSCFLLPCHAILTSSAVPVGTVSATATYQGDTNTQPSSGSTALTVTANTNPGSSSTVTCFAGQTCDSGTLTSSDGTTQADVSSGSSTSTQTVTASLDTSDALHGCVEPAEQGETPDGDDDDGVFVGAVLAFTTTGTGQKTITYTGTGDTGTIMRHQLSEHPTHAGCYGSPNAFKGFVNGSYTNAVFNSQDGLYEAILATCTFTQNLAGNTLRKQILPCMKGVAGAAGTTDYSYVITAPAGDPKTYG
jgi:hypothetical protein